MATKVEAGTPSPNEHKDLGGVLEQHRERMEDDRGYREAVLGGDPEPGPRKTDDDEGILEMGRSTEIDPAVGGIATGKAVPSTVPTALSADHDD